MTKSISKVNLASLKVLYTLQLLYERNLSMNDLIKYYELYHNEFITNFVMSKYINTCRYCGIDIKKINGEYILTNFPLGINFRESEVALFAELRNCCEKFKVSNVIEKVQSFFEKVNRRVERPISPISTSKENDSKIKPFEKACILQQRIKVVFNDDSYINCEPVDISITEDKIVFTIFDGQDTREISPEEIQFIKILPQRSKTGFVSMTVIYELKSTLAKKYQLRPHEQLSRITATGDYVITNRYEDKDKLLRRLLRYGDYCKVVSPNSCVIEMKQLLDDTLKNYS